MSKTFFLEYESLHSMSIGNGIYTYNCPYHAKQALKGIWNQIRECEPLQSEPIDFYISREYFRKKSKLELFGKINVLSEFNTGDYPVLDGYNINLEDVIRIDFGKIYPGVIVAGWDTDHDLFRVLWIKKHTANFY